jgi:Flp pilus assembly pilin Flp
MATWKKVIVSGSNVSQLNNDANYVSSTGAGILSSSAQIATDISGAFTEVSTTLAGRIATFESASVISSSAQIESDISGAFTEASGGFSTRIESLESSVGAGGLLSSSAQIASDISGAFTEVSTTLAGRIATFESASVISSSVEGDAQGQIKFNGVNVDANNLGTNDSPTFTNLTLSGNLFVNGTTTTINTDNLNIEDKFILLNSGSKTSPANEGGIIVESGSAVGTGTAFYFDGSDNRWSLKDSLSATNTAAVTSNAFMSSVVTDDTNVRYRKVGNIRIDGEDIFIYS